MTQTLAITSRQLIYMYPNVKGNLQDRMRQMSTSKWGMNTNIQAVFDKLLDLACKNKVDQKLVTGIRDAHSAWSKSYDSIKNMKVPAVITSPEEYRRAKDMIDRIAAQPLIDFEKKYGSDQAFELAWS